MKRPSDLLAAILFAALLRVLTAPTEAHAYNANDIISGIAGNGSPGYSGDAGPAVNAQLSAPRAVAFDATGSAMYICDVGSHVVRRVSMTSGLISTVAGTGTAGYNGDNISATTAQLNSPYALTVDGTGNLYIADSGNNRIRKVSTAGTITTVAGTGAAGCGNDTGDPGAATLSNPGGLTFDSAGNLLIADTGNGVIRKIGGGMISTFAGTCGGPSYTPNGMTADTAGNVYFADANHNRVYTISGAGTVTAFAGSGAAGYAGDGSTAAASNVSLNHPYTVARDSAGNVYIGDSSNHVVRVVTPDSVIHTAAGNGTTGNSGDGASATSAELNFTFGVGASPAGVWVVVDGSSNPVVRAVGPVAPVLVTIVGSGISAANDGVISADRRINCPGTCGANYVKGLPLMLAAAPLSADALFQWTGSGCNGHNGCTLLPQTLQPTSVTAHFTGWYIKTLLGGSVGPLLHSPFALTFDAGGNLYFTESTDCLVRKRTPAGALSTIAGNGVCGNIGDGIPATEAELADPEGVAVDAAGNVYIQDAGNGLIRKVTGDGMLHDFVSAYTGTHSPALAINPAGDLLMIGSAGTILRVTPAGISQSFATVNYVALDGLAVGNEGQVVAYGAYDFSDAAYTFVSNQGVQHGYVYFTGYSPNPAGLVLDQRGVEYGGLGCGILAYQSDFISHGFTQVQLVPDACGYAGDGGPASAASLNGTPTGLAFDNAGFLHVADSGNNAIRTIYPDAVFTADMDE